MVILRKMYTNDLENLIMERHQKNGADDLIILGGYISVAPIQKLSKKSIDATVIYGCHEYLTHAYHSKYIALHRDKSFKTDILYANSRNHTKIYCWKKNSKVIDALSGSANFSHAGLNSPISEILYEIEPKYFTATGNYVDSVVKDSTPCDKWAFKAKKLIFSGLKKKIKYDEIISTSPPVARLSLRSANGRFEDSGINVGQKKLTGSHVNINDCYVPIRSELIDAIPDLFPNKGLNPNVGKGYGAAAKKRKATAEFLFDDGEIMEISFEQKGPLRAGGHLYKAFRSFNNNARLGKYLRKRMSIPSGIEFKEKDFTAYGKDYIELTKLAEGQYYADFSSS